MKIKIADITAGYGRAMVLKDLTWEIEAGVTGLLGPNGAGKTTLLHLLAGVTQPRRGTITAIDDRTSMTSGQRGYTQRVSFVPQHFSLAAEMLVLDTVAYAAWVNGVSRRQCRDAAHSALAQVDLTDKARVRVRSLSGGQRQRLGVAAALAHEPELLILDEPTVGLDPTQRMRLREVIATVGERRSVVLSTHLVEDVSYLCQRVGILTSGQMAFDGDIGLLTDMVDDAEGLGRGSTFERAYAGIIERLGSHRD